MRVIRAPRRNHFLPNEVVFARNVQGIAVPTKPWPQAFYISGSLLATDAVEVRPLTFTGLIKGVGRNLVTMMWWRLLYALRLLGFLTTPEACVLSLRDLTWRPWRYQMVHRFRWARALRRAHARARKNF